jgi:hypothetical protein
MPYANFIFGTLPEYLKAQFGTYLKVLIERAIITRNELPVEMAAKIPTVEKKAASD